MPKTEFKNPIGIEGISLDTLINYQIRIEIVPLILQVIEQFQTLIAACGAGLIAVWFNRSKINLDKRVFKRELFEKYNHRYDNLNNSLLSLHHWELEIILNHQLNNTPSLEEVWKEISTGSEDIPESIATVYDYVNLCSEEFYWYKCGFVDADVWRCWNDGMKKWYSKSFFIKTIVDKEHALRVRYYNKDFTGQWLP